MANFSSMSSFYISSIKTNQIEFISPKFLSLKPRNQKDLTMQPIGNRQELKTFYDNQPDTFENFILFALHLLKAFNNKISPYWSIGYKLLLHSSSSLMFGKKQHSFQGHNHFESCCLLLKTDNIFCKHIIKTDVREKGCETTRACINN